jgi:3-phosphoshikimate 1-carboxyvinyltransferase
LTGTIYVPGDKSISHRALMLGALAEGRSLVAAPNLGADVLATAGMLSALGAKLNLDPDKSRVEVEGCGWSNLREPESVLDAGNSGTAIRLMLGICSAVKGTSVLTGDESIRSRPMLRVVEPLREMGAVIEGRALGDRAPLMVSGRPLHGVYDETGSAQVKSAVLFAGLSADGTTTVTEIWPSRDHTERMLVARGVRVGREGTTVTLAGGQALEPCDQIVPGDFSSAMFLIVAALILPGSDLTIAGVGLNPTRTHALDVLRAMGGEIESVITAEHGGEPSGDIRVVASELHGVEVTPEDVPLMIDEIPALAVAATQAHGTTNIRGASELRIKESDRIGALVEGLGALGADIVELGDGLSITGPARLAGGRVDSRGDHRIAMALAIAGLVADGNVKVHGWSSVATSFPEFLDVLAEAQDRK